LVHETTHGYQYDDKPESEPPGWIIEGIADYVRLQSGHFGPGLLHAGGTWTDSYQTTGFFLAWLDTQYEDFGYRLNQSLSPTDGSPWSKASFAEITGKPIAELWSDYQAAMALP
jgi:hypothetical protein